MIAERKRMNKMRTSVPMTSHCPQLGSGTGAVVLVIAVAATGISPVVFAQSAGGLMVRGGVTKIAPDVSSGDLTAPSLAGTQADVRSDTRPAGGITWMWSDNVSVDLPLSVPFEHDIVGAGAIAGVGKIAEVRAYPVTLLAQYRFLGAGAALRPYVGLGPTYAKFYKARSAATLTALTGGSPSNPTTISIESKWAPTAQFGLGWAMTSKWQLDANFTRTPLKTRATLSSGQTLDVRLDPWSYGLGIAYRF